MSRWTRMLGLAFALVAAGCGPRIAPLVPVLENGEVVRSQTEEVVARARVETDAERERIAEEQAAVTGRALAACAPAICDAITRGELALGMTEPQVLAATRSTTRAWDTRSSGAGAVMTARPGERGAADAVGEIAYVRLQNGVVAGYTYREPQGYRTVSSPADATLRGGAAARADALLRQGDQYVAAGRLDLALQAYDQADVLRPDHPETTLRIAQLLDKQLRPIEAVLRYRLFIHQMELERLRAEGEVAARIAEAIARARERVVVIEKR